MIGSRCWNALLRRNLLYRKRYFVSTIFEFILPICGIWILIAIKNATLRSTSSDGNARMVGPFFPDANQTKQPLTFNDYLTSLQSKKVCVYNATFDKFYITGIVSWRWMVPLVRCDSRKCQFDGQDASTAFCQYKTIGVAGAPSRVYSFLSYIQAQYPALSNSTRFPQNYSIIRPFDSIQDMDEYVQSPDYLTSKTMIAIGIVFHEDDDDPNVFSYSIRPNSTHVNSPENFGSPGLATTPDPQKIVVPFAKQNNDSCVLKPAAPYLGPDQFSCTMQYMYNGVITMQRLVQDYILYDVQQEPMSSQSNSTATTNSTVYISEAGVQFVPFPTRRFKKDGVFASISGFGALLITLGLLFPVTTMTSYITQEKELRQKELMKMMSVLESDIGWSWFISFLMFHGVITSLGVTIVSSVLYGESQFLLLWLFWILTFTATIVLCMSIAACFTKSLRGILVSVLVFFGGSILAVAIKLETASSAWITFISIHPIATMSYGLEQIGLLEDQGAGLTMDSIGLSLGFDSGYSFRSTMLALCFDCVFWGFVSWYLNRVVTPEYGQALPFYFPFLASYWLPPRSIDTAVGDGKLTSAQPEVEIPYEPVSEALRRQSVQGESIEIHNLRKVFGTQKIAVDGLSLSMYKGQITALLGHNGAGKTTTIGMITGALAPTEGYATITGRDIRTSMGSIRQNIGICLQHDCLFPMLTCREHLQFFARVKGLYASSESVQAAEESIDQSLRDVALFEKRDTYSKSLSGGMKRKLSVAIAFSGGSEVVVLDEPTSGMDPFSRRFTWNVIRQYRQDRCIILTTHFMDEADILGDRIAIMAEGQLRCAGSSMFLKKTYGVGYHLTVDKGSQPEQIPSSANSANEDIDTLVNDIVLKNVKDSALLNHNGLEVHFQLPMDSSSNFPKMFKELDIQVDRKNIQSYGVGMTTLDEVFLLVARGESEVGNRKPLGSSKKLLQDNSPITDRTVKKSNNLSERSNSTRMQLEKEGLFGRHVIALTYKRAANFSRDKKAWCCTTLAPTFCVLLSLILVKVTTPNRNLKPITLKMSDLNPDVTDGPTNPIWYNTPDAPLNCQPGRCAYDPPVAPWNVTNELYGFCGYLSRKLDPAAPKWDNNRTCSISESQYIMSMMDNAQEISNVSNMRNFSKKLMETSDVFQATQYGALVFTHDPTSVIIGPNSTNETFSASTKANCQLNSLYVNYTNPSDCSRFGGIGYAIQYNYTAIHIAPLMQAYADEAIIRRTTNNNEFRINVTIAPLPITSFESSLSEAQDRFLVFILAVLGFPMVAGAFGAFIVAERESKAKHLQTVAGVIPEAYWLSTIVWDTLNYQIPMWITIALFFMFKMTTFTTSERGAFPAIVLLLFLYGPASAAYTYCLTFLFKSPSLCTLVTVVSNFLFGMGGPITLFIMELLTANPNGETDLRNVITILSWALRFNPTFCLGKGIFYVLNIQFFVYVERDINLSAFSSRILLWDLIFLGIHILVYMPLAVQIDKWSTNPSVVALWKKIGNLAMCKGGHSNVKDLGDISEVDSDVAREEDRVLSGEANTDLIVLSKMSKVYNNGKRAVDNISLGIPPGQCFGLLGINGAGKTTTMAMLTAEFPPSSGDATLAGFSVSNEPQKTRRRIGYCPQFDAHFVNMTGREHIEMYAVIKGVPLNAVKEAACEKLKEIGLSAFDGDRLCSTYSGGMRRRLSLGIATVGSPQIVFLDECSTGVDPVARREIWEMVNAIVSDETVPLEERASVILTTHSMEECEALCPRIGIMANGRLRCLGSAQQLKNKFGQGYQVEIKIALVRETDDDYVSIATKFAESNKASIDALDSIFCNLATVLFEVRKLTNDETLSKLITSDNPVGYSVWKDSNSGQGATLESLAVFAASELRMQKLDMFLREKFSGLVLRERQDLKVRYEVSSNGTRISSIFTQIEDNKESLWLDDYSVSQTSLEQVFNMHAAEAEKAKEGQNDA